LHKSREKNSALEYICQNRKSSPPPHLQGVKCPLGLPAPDKRKGSSQIQWTSTPRKISPEVSGVAASDLGRQKPLTQEYKIRYPMRSTKQNTGKKGAMSAAVDAKKVLIQMKHAIHEETLVHILKRPSVESGALRSRWIMPRTIKMPAYYRPIPDHQKGGNPCKKDGYCCAG
jgi:hypothetical protein